MRISRQIARGSNTRLCKKTLGWKVMVDGLWEVTGETMTLPSLPHPTNIKGERLL